MSSNWYPEGGFYEGRAKQGESDWEDQANYDPPLTITNEDMRTVSGKTGSAISISDLTKEESYAFDTKNAIYGT